jgi:hypothetical protein
VAHGSHENAWGRLKKTFAILKLDPKKWQDPVATRVNMQTDMVSMQEGI